MPVPGIRSLLILSLVVFPAAAVAEPTQPVAIVEDVTENLTSVTSFHLLHEGDALALTAEQGIIISYLDSCQRESIRGGTIRIGRQQSEVSGGTIQRQAVPCDPVALALTPAQANQSAALAFRDPDDPTAGDPVAAQAAFVLPSRFPVVVAPGLTEITIEDLRNPPRVWRRQAETGVFTLTDDGAPLDKGGVYRVSGAGRSVVFRIGREASDAPLPILKRLIKL